MRVPVSWLRDYVNITLPVEELAEILTIAGLEVESIDYIGIAGGDDPDRLVWDPETILLGRILQVEQHPDADRLVLATVDYGGAEPEVTVTGAPNLFPYLGQGDLADQELFVAFALEGAELYDGHKEGQKKMKLKGRKLRGIYNRCMVCSEKELGISDEHDGVIILPDMGFPTGTPLQDVLGDAVLNIDIIPNIARCASMVGVAREVAALTGQQLHEPPYDVLMDGPAVDGKVVIRTENPDLNPRFVGLVISGVSQKPSPFWMQHRLRLAGQRPINVVVDVSNYVMLEMGQPNHTFDYDFLRRRADQYAGADGPVEIITRLAHDGETLKTLDGVVHQLQPHNILVTDPAGNLSLGGIMGGLESEIQEDTSNVLLEAAAWNYINIRRSGHGLKINTEAGFRFSRGVHPSQALLGAKRAAELLRQLAGGTVWQGIIDTYPAPPPTVVVDFDPHEVRRLGGLDLSAAESAALLRRLQFGVAEQNGRLQVTVPDHRLDIEGAHDLVEEICRMYGYDRLPVTIMDDELPPQRNNDALARETAIKDGLAELGLQEIITYRLTTPAREKKLIPRTAGLPADERPYVTLANPITVDRVSMRHSLLASVLEVAAENSRYQEHIGIFEIGQIYIAAEEGSLPEEKSRLAITLTGRREAPYWNDGEPQPVDFFDLKGIVEDLLARLHVQGVTYEAHTQPSFRPGRTARLLAGDQQLGVIGELHPLVVEQFNIRGEAPVLAADIDLDLLLPLIPERFSVDALVTYPPVVEDLALVVDQSVPAQAVEDVLRQTGGRLLASVVLFDVYTGNQLPAGKKSLAYRLTFQAPNRTLTDRDVGKQRQRILRAAEKQVGAQLR